MGDGSTNPESLNGQNVHDILPMTRPAECLGSNCTSIARRTCEARWQLLEVNGVPVENETIPLVEDPKYAWYGFVCMGGVNAIVRKVTIQAVCGPVSTQELAAQLGRFKPPFRFPIDT